MNSMENANKILFRCSSLGHIMTEPRSKSEVLSESCKTHLADVFVSAKYGRNSDIANRYVKKGTMVEEDSLTLYSRVKRLFYTKNEEWFSNEFISGTPDIILVDGAMPTEIIDIKSSWDIHTFFRAKSKELNKLYYWQLMGYMALTGAKSGRIAYCLVSTPELLQEAERKTLWYKMGQPSGDNNDWIQACAELDKAMVYDDIPMQERVYDEFVVERNEEEIERIYTRVKDCRTWMNENLFTIPERIDVEGV
jgi:hypothetical protein